MSSFLSGDSVVLTKKNIPSFSLNLNSTEVEKIKCTELDTIDNYDPESLRLVGEFALNLIGRIEQKNSDFFKQRIPDNFKEMAEKYFANLRLYQE